MGFRIAQLSVKGPTLPFARDRTSCGIDTGCGLLLFVALMILLSNLVTKRAYPPEGRRTGAASPISSTFWLQIAGRCGEVANCLASFPCLDDSTNHENGRRTVALRYGLCEPCCGTEIVLRLERLLRQSAR